MLGGSDSIRILQNQLGISPSHSITSFLFNNNHSMDPNAKQGGLANQNSNVGMLSMLQHLWNNPKF
jgi:hypothetical protein